MSEHIRIGLVSISDRASDGTYEDQGIPALKDWLGRALSSPWSAETRLIPDERALIERTLVELVDVSGCNLVLTTGGTGPAVRDVTPEATLAIGDKEMPGFGEEMRRIHGRLERLLREVGGARIAALLAEVDGDTDALVAVVLDGVDLAAAHRHRLAEALGDIGLARRGAVLAGVFEDVGGDLGEMRLREGEALAGHGRAGCVQRL